MLSARLHISRKTAKKIGKIATKAVLFALIIISIFAASAMIYGFLLFGKIYPNIFVAGIKVGGLTPEVGVTLLSQKVSAPSQLNLISEDQSFSIETKDINLSYDYAASVLRAYQLTRSGNIFFDLAERLKLINGSENIGLSTNINEEKLTKIISVFSGQVSSESKAASINIVNGTIQVDKGRAGREVDEKLLIALIESHLSTLDESVISIPVIIIDNSLSDTEVESAHARGQKMVGKSLLLNFETYSLNLTDAKLAQYMAPRGGINSETLNELSLKIADDINRNPQNPKFQFENGKVSEFQPALDGIVMNQDQFKSLFTDSLALLEGADEKSLAFNIPVTRTPPEISTGQVNSYGIKELIGRGISTYYHSIPSRVHNIVLASNRINGTLVKPGETFSFNDTLGDVSQFTGYQQAYIIENGKTILGDGGGVCQVSTTLFRAVLNAGLPVTDRTAHAYRVGYYEQNSPPGFDATIYGPSPDFKFKNDTAAFILIVAKPDTKHYSLTFELYGTSDGRVATFSKPVVTDQVAPPEDLYQDDPTLPAGTIKQIDFKAWGAKVIFNYKVIRGSEVLISRTFISNYRPWQAVYLRGTGPAI